MFACEDSLGVLACDGYRRFGSYDDSGSTQEHDRRFWCSSRSTDNPHDTTSLNDELLAGFRPARPIR